MFYSGEGVGGYVGVGIYMLCDYYIWLSGPGCLESAFYTSRRVRRRLGGWGTSGRGVCTGGIRRGGGSSGHVAAVCPALRQYTHTRFGQSRRR